MAEKKEKIDSTMWPAWRYGPGGVGEIFQTPEDVPEGWTDHPTTAPPIEQIDL